MDAPMTMRQAVAIQELHSAGDFRAVEELQLRVWGTDPGWIVPVHVLHIAVESGGIVLGAYAGDILAGFVLGFLGRSGEGLYHASHMLGIHPDFQGQGLGTALKLKQREVALAQGLALMTWTFDPLAARNAHFNMHKLGTVARTYREDLYGDMPDSLNRGLPSDRLYVEWYLEREVGASPTGPALDEATPIVRNDGGAPRLSLDEASPLGPLSIAVPSDIHRLKALDPQLANEWHGTVREAFLWALERRYVAVDFVDGAYLLLPTAPWSTDEGEYG